MFRIKHKSVVGVTVVVAVCGSLVATAAAQVTVHRVAPKAQGAVRYLGKASVDDNGLLKLDVSQVVAGRGAQALLVGRDARLLTGPATRLLDLQGKPVARALLDHATVRVLGRLLPLSAWSVNDEGERLPTIRAARIVVLQLEPQDEADTETTSAQDQVETDND